MSIVILINGLGIKVWSKESKMKTKVKKGGARPGAGRPPKEKIRINHTLRLYDDEWDIVRDFVYMVKYGDKEACRQFIKNKEYVICND